MPKGYENAKESVEEGLSLSEGEAEGGKSWNSLGSKGKVSQPVGRRRVQENQAGQVKEVKESGEGKVETKAERKGQEAAEEVENEGRNSEDAL